jgi:hypothetical protein
MFDIGFLQEYNIINLQFTAMKRISKEEDSEREENSPAERFSKIIFFEPALKAADEKSCRRPALWAYKRIICCTLF